MTTSTSLPPVRDDAPAPGSAARATPGRPRLVLVAGVCALLVAAVLVGRLSAGSGDPGDGPRPAGAADVAPYDDPDAAGRITLCSADGEPVTGGSTTDRPFAARAVGESGVPADLDPTGAVATLFAYQPRVGVQADEFSGLPLTAAQAQADPARPEVAIGSDVYSVADVLAGYPATYDGFVQLRLYLGTPEAGTLTDRPYDTVDLQVDGDRWALVGGGTASCS